MAAVVVPAPVVMAATPTPTTMMNVTVPEGVTPGVVFNIQTPTGAMMAVTCPDGVTAGALIQVSVPSVAAPMPASSVDVSKLSTGFVVGKVKGLKMAPGDGESFMLSHAHGMVMEQEIHDLNGTKIATIQYASNNIEKGHRSAKVVATDGNAFIECGRR